MYVLFIDSVNSSIHVADGLCGHQNLVDICRVLWYFGTRLFSDSHQEVRKKQQAERGRNTMGLPLFRRLPRNPLDFQQKFQQKYGLRLL